jgi:hypothetical protein
MINVDASAEKLTPDRVKRLSQDVNWAYISWTSESHKWAGGDHKKSDELKKVLEEKKAKYTSAIGYDAEKFIEELVLKKELNFYQIDAHAYSRSPEDSNDLTKRVNRVNFYREKESDLIKQIKTLKEAREKAEQSAVK